MKLFAIPLLSLFFTAVYAVTIVPSVSGAAATGLVCAMSVCPTASLDKRDLACPVYCTEGCRVIDDPCCPGSQKTVCSSSNTTSIATDSRSVLPTSTYAFTTITTSASIGSTATSPASISQPSSTITTASPTASSSASSKHVSLPTTMAAFTLLLIITAIVF